MLARLFLVADPADAAAERPQDLLRKLEFIFPTLYANVSSRPPSLEHGIAVSAREWSNTEFDFYRFDEQIDELDGEGSFSLVIDDLTDDVERVVTQLITRAQRAMRRRNIHSASRQFDRLLVEHRRLHDLSKPLVRADYRHALDTWQWVVRLSPGASAAVQIAALFHDIERLESEADERHEQHAADYRSFKNAHARGAVTVVRPLLTAMQFASDEVDRACLLIEEHETTSRANVHENRLLNDADSLSFFSLNSNGFFDYFDREHCVRKVDYTLNRMSAPARDLLRSVRLRKDVALLAGIPPDQMQSPTATAAFAIDAPATGEVAQ